VCESYSVGVLFTITEKIIHGSGIRGCVMDSTSLFESCLDDSFSCRIYMHLLHCTLSLHCCCL